MAALSAVEVDDTLVVVAAGDVDGGGVEVDAEGVFVDAGTVFVDVATEVLVALVRAVVVAVGTAVLVDSGVEVREPAVDVTLGVETALRVAIAVRVPSTVARADAVACGVVVVGGAVVFVAVAATLVFVLVGMLVFVAVGTPTEVLVAVGGTVVFVAVAATLVFVLVGMLVFVAVAGTLVLVLVGMLVFVAVGAPTEVLVAVAGTLVFVLVAVAGTLVLVAVAGALVLVAVEVFVGTAPVPHWTLASVRSVAKVAPPAARYVVPVNGSSPVAPSPPVTMCNSLVLPAGACASHWRVIVVSTTDAGRLPLCRTQPAPSPHHSFPAGAEPELSLGAAQRLAPVPALFSVTLTKFSTAPVNWISHWYPAAVLAFDALSVMSKFPDGMTTFDWMPPVAGSASTVMQGLAPHAA